MEKSALEGKVAAELHQIASDLGIEGHRGLRKADLIERILARANGQNPSAGAAAATVPSSAGTPREASPPPADAQSAGPEGGTGETRTDVRRENAPAPSGNGGVRQDDRVRDRPREQRFERGGGERPPYRDGQG
ncbi:MAG: Rho termination factor N-terminal domain-containing protein, partial [Actinomycetota bacterium]